jgi:hypothetical protein
MRLRSTLLQIAAVLSAATACSSGSSGTSNDQPRSDGGAGPDASGADAGDSGPQVGCGGCNCGAPDVTEGRATPDQACAILAAPGGSTGAACSTFCRGLNPGSNATSFYCGIPADYRTAYQNAQTETSTVDAGNTCPAWQDDVVVQCGYPCLGRRTAGIDDPAPCDLSALGAVFANRAYFEAVSVHAFARLERELAFHRAPAALLRSARRARRDEIRHTAMTARLARRFGASTTLPEAPGGAAARSLFEVARENAVEGCVRETYGAVMGLVEASTSSDGDVRRASRSIAADECRHAELALAVARWIDPLLTAAERTAVRRAVTEAIDDLRGRGDERVVELLASRVWDPLADAARDGVAPAPAIDGAARSPASAA